MISLEDISTFPPKCQFDEGRYREMHKPKMAFPALEVSGVSASVESILADLEKNDTLQRGSLYKVVQAALRRAVEGQSGIDAYVHIVVTLGSEWLLHICNLSPFLITRSMPGLGVFVAIPLLAIFVWVVVVFQTTDAFSPVLLASVLPSIIVVAFYGICMGRNSRPRQAVKQQ